MLLTTTIREVELAIRGENISLPAGTLEADNIVNANLVNPQYKFNQTAPIKSQQIVILLSDVAELNLVRFWKNSFKAQTKDQINLKTVGIGIYARS